jgi:hypothetical protein
VSLNDVSIILTAGSRPGYLRQALLGLTRNLPECKVIVVNDDRHRPMTPSGYPLYSQVIWKEMPSDTWLTKKRNAGVQLVDTKYTLLGCDDFKFDIDIRRVVIRMMDILDAYRLPDVIAGTFNNRPYEGYLNIVPGQYIKEIPLDVTRDEPLVKSQACTLWKVDIAVNFFLARTHVMKAVPWDEAIGPIGGEHADWYIDMKNAGKVIVWTPGLGIEEQEKDPQMEDADYGFKRRRVWDGHAMMLKKRGVKKYYGFDEEVK